MRAFDWSTHPLGPPPQWPESLRIAVDMMLQVPESMYIVWGPALHFFSNDTYAPLLGPRLDRSIGTTLPLLWPDAWEAVWPPLEKSFAGETSRFVDMPIDMARQGVPEKTWWTFSFSPIRDEHGKVAGVLCITNEQTGRILSQHAQRASDERNRQILDSAIDYAIISTDLQARVTTWNEGARRIMGWTEEEMLGHTAERFFTPDDIAAGVPLREMAETLARGRGSDERWHLRKSGERFWASGEMMALRDEAGEVTGFLKILRDRTQQRRDAERLRVSQMRLDIAHDTGLLSFFDWDVRQGIARGDANFARAYGFTVAEVAQGVPLAAVLERADPQYRQRYSADVAASAASATDYAREVKVRHPDGTVRWLMVRATCTARNGPLEPLAFTGIAVDITATKTAEELLRRANESLERRVAERTRERDRTWNLSRDLMGVADAQGVWLSVNPAFERTLGWPAEQIVGRTSEWMEHPDDVAKTRGEVRGLAAGAVTQQFVNRFRDHDGDYHWLSWTAVMDDGLLYCNARDVTEATERQAQLELAEEALRQAQKMEAIGQLTGGVAHDFNNLLTIIRSSVDLMRHPRMTEDRRGRYLAAISDTVDRASRLTSQLLAFARRQALLPEVFEVNHRILTVAEMIRTMVGSLVQVEVRSTLEPQYTHADTSQFDTAMVNMAVNARDAMEGHGRIRIAVRRVNGIPARSAAQPAIAGEFVAVSVSDDGHGIPAELIDKVFEPFFTTKAIGKGTGLGLSQVFGFVRQSGGETRLESVVGEGTTFTLYLRASAPPAADASAPRDLLALDSSLPGQGTRVLLVEDNREVGTFSSQILQDLGYLTQWATSGEQALELLADAENRYDVVLTDVMMPGISGVELALGLRVTHPDLPVILTSGYSNVLAQDSGHGFPLVQKPYSVEMLAKALGHAVRRGR